MFLWKMLYDFHICGGKKKKVSSTRWDEEVPMGDDGDGGKDGGREGRGGRKQGRG